MVRQWESADLADEPQQWPVLRQQVLGRGSVSDFVDDLIATPDGGRMQRQYTLHPGAVGVIAWDDEDRIAVVRQYRHPVGFALIEPPAGLLDHDREDVLAAAQRELAEEAGLAADDWRVLVDLFTTPGACQESLRIFLARGLRPTDPPDGFVAEGEEANMEVAWAARADLVAAIQAGRLQNPTMVAGVLALEVARLAGQLGGLRDPSAPWSARTVREAQNTRLAAARGEHLD